MTRKNKLPEAPARLDHKDEVGKTDLLPGWPGYRTRDGRSGYDPIDTRTEAAHVSGSIIRDLFTGNLMLRNRLSLSLSGVLGLLLVAPVFITVLELIKGNLFSWEAGLTLFIAGLFGLALLTNFVKNLRRGNRE